MVRCSRYLPAAVAVALVALVAAPGCTRNFFRNYADKDVEGVITQKNVFPAWQVKNWHVYPDPRARFADPTNPDRPPYPPDDFAARLLSPNPQHPTKKSGVGRIDGDGYLGILQQWDAQNRGEAALAMPGVATRYTPTMAEAVAAPAIPQPGATPVAARPVTPAAPPTALSSRVAIPAPTVIAGDRPAVRHPLPPWAPPALRTGGAAPATQQAEARPQLAPEHRAAVQPSPVQPAAAQTPVTPPVPAKAAPGEFGPWSPIRPAPALTELRAPHVTATAGFDGQGRAVPAAAAVPVGVAPATPAVGTQPAPVAIPFAPVPSQSPTPAPAPAPAEPFMKPQARAVPPAPPQPVPLPQVAAQPPAPQPIPQAQPKQPETLPRPKPVDPKPPYENRGADPVGKGLDELPPLGDPASDYLRALQSGQVGYLIKLDQSIELGVLNAREFQDRREDVYLAALAVTLQRYSFAAQFFSTEQAVLRSSGRSVAANNANSWTLGTTNGVGKLFPTGAQLMAQLATQIVIDTAHGRPTVAISNASLSFLQPLLRGGGYAVTLENLTQAERNLLYALRSYARFRKLFYVSMAAGIPSGYTNNPYGLQGLSQNLGRGVGSNLTAPSVGFLPLLQQQAVINNQRKNVAALERLLRLYQAFREGGQQSDLQVGQVEVQLLNNRSSLLGSPTSGNSTSGIRGYLDTLDNFKLQLGLPLTVPLDLDDGPLQPIRQQLTKFEEVYAQVREVELAGAKYDRAEPLGDFRTRWLRLLTGSALVKGTPFATQIAKRWESWWPARLNDDQARNRLAGLREERRKLLAARVERELKKQPEPPAEVARLAALEAEIDLAEFEFRVREYEAQPWAKRPAGRERDGIQDSAFNAAYNAFYLVILEARNERLRALYRSWPTLAPLPIGCIDVRDSTLDEAYTAAIQTALSSRLDLMNARAQVVDAWRQIAVTANSLKGVLNVQYNLGASTPAGGSNPFAFAGNLTTNQLSFNAQLPLVRRAERNNYRAALIAYQRQRRFLMAFEDNIANDVRSDVRELRTLTQLYRIQQRVVELQYGQVDNATAILFAPPVPGAGSDAGSAAALTTQVLQAQTNLVSAQNTLYQLWVAYMTSRMSFYLDLEQMQLDDRGVWIDEFFNRADRPEQPDARQQPGERLHAPRPVVPDGGPRP